MREEREVGVRGFEGDKGDQRRSRSRRTLWILPTVSSYSICERTERFENALSEIEIREQ